MGNNRQQYKQDCFNSLMKQIKNIMKHNRQGSFKTKERYYEAMKRFCRFAADHFELKKVKNLQDKHLKAYIDQMKSQNLSPATIKTDLAAVRFYHDKCEKTRYRLSSNQELGYTEKRKFGGVDRAWSNSEYQKFKEVCKKYGNERASAVATLARNEGLRIHETLKIRRNHVEEALRTGMLYVKGKGGKERWVPLTDESKNMLKIIIQDIPRGERLFVHEGERHDRIQKQIQNFINRHRNKWQDPDRDVNRTFHGLRHAYARDRYEEFKAQGLSDYQAREEVSKLLGHERDDVTRIYLNK